jgi:Deoxyhypusine synthase
VHQAPTGCGLDVDMCAVLHTVGARPDEAVSWGKLRLDAKPTKIYADATILFPLLVSQTFAKLTAEEIRARAASRQKARHSTQPQ